MGATDKGAEKRVCGCPDLGPDILGGGKVGIVVRVGDVGDDSMHREDVGLIPPQGGPQADGEATSSKEGWRVDITPTRACDVGGETAGGGDLRLLTPEHSHTVHCDQDHYGPMSGRGAETGDTGIQAVVAT